jgi:hypothetical protein
LGSPQRKHAHCATSARIRASYRALVRRLNTLHDALDRAITERLSEADLVHFAAALTDVNAALKQML